MNALDTTRALVGIAGLGLALLALRGARWQYARWAYAGYIASALLYFPLRAGGAISPRQCALAFDRELALLSLQNHGHIVLFAAFFLLSLRQFRGPHAALWAGAATLSMGALVELAQGLTGAGNCRLRDLLPDAAGALLGSLLVAAAGGLWSWWYRLQDRTTRIASR